MQNGWAVCVQVEQSLQDLEGPALDGHLTDVAQVLLAVPGGGGGEGQGLDVLTVDIGGWGPAVLRHLMACCVGPSSRTVKHDAGHVVAMSVVRH